MGAFPAGLSHSADVRPQQQLIEYWDGPVRPEIVEPGSPQWERWQLHRAANLYHVSQSLSPNSQLRLYKVAWVASCILYDREKLLEVGGFSFWSRLPRFHSGEEVLVQNLLMRLWGGCAIVPSGTYYAQVPTTVLNDAGTVDGHALELLSEMVERYAPMVKMLMTDPFAPGLLQRLSEPPRKVVLLRASRIGDFLCTTPAFRALRAALPEAEITIITLPLLLDLVERSPSSRSLCRLPRLPRHRRAIF